MKLRNTALHYGSVAKFLHWVIGLAMIGMLAVGIYMTGLEPSDTKWWIYGIHKSLGITLLIAVTLRIFWKLINPVPKMPEGTPLWQKAALKLTHLSLYLLMLFMPLIGWVMSSAGGHPVSLWGLKVPALVQKNKELGGWANELHELGGWVMIGFISLHVFAALYHQFVKKDGILLRMMPFGHRCKSTSN